MSRSKSASIALGLAVMFISVGCAGVRGELVETGIAETAETDFAAAGGSLSGTNVDSSSLSADEWWAAPADERERVRSASGLAAEWTAVPEAWDFHSPELFSGAPLAGKDLFESGSVLVNFVSPGCPISVEDAEAFAAAAERNPSVTFVFAHTDGATAEYEQFVEDSDLFQQNVVHVNDSDLALWNRFGIADQPSTILIKGDGSASVTTGGLGHEGVANAVDLVSDGLT